MIARLDIFSVYQIADGFSLRPGRARNFGTKGLFRAIGQRV
jgi:hypothetical protein